MATSEQEYRQKIQELESRIEELTDFLENGSIPLHWVNEDGIVTWANKAELDVLGYSREEYIGKPIAQVHADAHVLQDILERLRKNETLNNYPARLKSKNGELKHVLINSNVRIKDGRFMHTRCFTRDVSDIVREAEKREGLLKELEQKNKTIAESEKRLEAEVQKRTEELVRLNELLNKKNEELRLGNSELQAFNYMAGHDLQEPLRKIQTFSALVRKELGETCSGKLAGYLDKISAAAGRMSRLMASLLDYAYVTNHNQAKSPTDLNQVLEEVKQQLKEQLAEKKMRITSDHLPTVNVVPFQFQQLFINLISNAIKYSREDVTPELSITAEKVEGDSTKKSGTSKRSPYWLLRFSDNGIGFNAEDAPHIFELFKRLHSKDEYEGSGIGLGICKRIVENHNGTIEAKGEPGKGAEFRIYLPA